MEFKLTVLRIILENKGVLFGGFSNILSKQDKRQKWVEITNTCHSLGVIPAAKDYTYVRDTYWPNIKKATMAKVDNSKKTGSAGGKDKRLTAVDELVLQILGKESPTVIGLNVPDIMEEQVLEAQPQEVVLNLPTTDPVVDQIPAELPSSLNTLSVNPSVANDENITRRRADTRRTVVTYGSRRHAELQEYNDLKKRKLEEDLKNTQLKNYKLELDIYEQELKLNIASSNFTQHIKSSGPLSTNQELDSTIPLFTNDSCSESYLI